ncbi:alpha/beta hydrolase [Shewanella litorisediminis]|uniref:Alpha/beta hydrolase n=1 Tax=Shewanella litorisediminis TaxID=1173586 RepID=A0ABX7G2K2_9GAMM|nr:alpha/beta hydrolase [Shewanella litorisediminis]MCL2917046.1 alpha/beta hydrolase [Shewanella litorisediminis]QRH01527.1 alpha/beta hydrolase [Shewanella litorisediminis]
MKLVMVHGWSVTDTRVYGGLPGALARFAPESLALDIEHIFLGRYISFNDEVRLADVADAFERARQERLQDSQFAVVTHSTGAPVIRTWLARYYSEGAQGSQGAQGPKGLKQCPLTHLIMLAPANHGSALAQLGKSRLGRLKSWFDGVEPGQQILDWLELGSLGQHQLSHYWLSQKPAADGLYPFVISGETIDSNLYDFLNSYTAEPGSDGVVRLAGANLNYRWLELTETQTLDDNGRAELLPTADKKAPVCGFEVLPRASHSGSKLGIMTSVSARAAKPRPVVSRILQCLQVSSAEGFAALCQEMADSSHKSGPRFTQLVVRVWDKEGEPIRDFDFLLLAGPDYDPGKLPKGFFQDRQKNQRIGNALTLYLNHDRMLKTAEGCWGFRILPRPGSGLAHYRPVEFRCAGRLADYLRADQTLMLDVHLTRHIHPHVFSLTDAASQGDFRQLAEV